MITVHDPIISDITIENKTNTTEVTTNSKEDKNATAKIHKRMNWKNTNKDIIYNYKNSLNHKLSDLKNKFEDLIICNNVNCKEAKHNEDIESYTKLW